MVTFSTIGERIKRLRELQGLNQTQFAHKIGVSQQQVSAYEHEDPEKRVEPGRPVILLICELFKVREEWLTSGIEPIYKVPNGEGSKPEEPEVYLNPKRARLVDLVKRLARSENTDEDSIKALLHIAEVFAGAPKKDEDEC